MRTAPGFVALWQSKDDLGEVKLHVIADNLHEITPVGSTKLSGLALEDCLPSKALSAVATRLEREGEVLLLLLDRSLPDAWLHYPWEFARLAGQALLGRLLAIRRAKPTFDMQGRDGEFPARYLNLFPSHEYDFSEAFEPLVKGQLLRPCRLGFVSEEIQGVPDLFIMAHGDTRGLLSSEGRPYALPNTRSLPQRVWLLACNEAGAMNKLAVELLERGTKTVIAAAGELSAPEMADVVKQWLGRSNVQDPFALLSIMSRNDSIEGGVRSLTFWGELALDVSPSAKWNKLTWDMNTGLQPRIPLDDETCKDEFKAAISVLDEPDTWPLTREWMLPPLLWLAERHDHVTMRDLERRLGDSRSPDAIRGLAASARRIGHYPQMARYLSTALDATSIRREERASFLGQLINLLIDLNLPDAAARAISHHEDCLIEDVRMRQIQDFYRLDWKARCAARQGRIDIAIGHMQAKRSQATQDDGRELAWLLYFGAWMRFAKLAGAVTVTAVAKEVSTRLSQVTPQDIGHGNETSAYLLRALATQSWVTANVVHMAQVQEWQQVANERLASDDPGPWAYVLAYMYLAGKSSNAEFGRAMAALESGRYFLEAAIFFALAGHGEDSARTLRRFQERRTRTIVELESCAGTLQIVLSLEKDKRKELERTVFDDPTAILATGFMPL